jgi:hypothetical protein
MDNPKVYTTTVKDCNDGSGDVYIEFPDQMLEELGWGEGTVVNFDLKVDDAGNVIVISAVA